MIKLFNVQILSKIIVQIIHFSYDAAIKNLPMLAADRKAAQ